MNRNSKFQWKEAWSVRCIAILTGIMGLINFLSALTPAMTERLVIIKNILPLEIRQGSRLFVVLAGFALMLLAKNLWRRKRAAWLLTVIILSVNIITHLLKGLDYEEAIFGGLLLLWMLTLAPHFHARSDQPSIVQGLRVLLFSFLFTMIYGVTGFYLLDHHFTVNFGLGEAICQTIVMFTQFYNPGLIAVTKFGKYFSNSIYTVSFLTIGYSLLMIIRPVFVRQPASSDDRNHARAIVQNFGRTGIARFTLFKDKYYFFSRRGSMIAYTVKGRIAVALGDPIGPDDDVFDTIREFKNFCTHNDWQIAFYQTLPDYLDLYRRMNLESICIGHEGVVDLSAFTLQGNQNKNLRTALNRLSKLNYEFKIIEPPVTNEVIVALKSISDEWLTLMRGSENRFSMGWFEESYLRETPVAVVYNSEGEITAFANIIPEYQKNSVAVDLMRRGHAAEPGTMEFLFVNMFEWARSKGYGSFSLGLSALAGLEHFKNAGVSIKALNYVYEHLNKIYNFKGLHAFKEKFQPQWLPRFLAYPGAGSLPPVLTALIRADSGDNWLLFIKRKPRPETGIVKQIQGCKTDAS